MARRASVRDSPGFQRSCVGTSGGFCTGAVIPCYTKNLLAGILSQSVGCTLEFNYNLKTDSKIAPGNYLIIAF